MYWVLMSPKDASTHPTARRIPNVARVEQSDTHRIFAWVKEPCTRALQNEVRDRSVV
jgi:hypothetical protein